MRGATTAVTVTGAAAATPGRLGWVRSRMLPGLVAGLMAGAGLAGCGGEPGGGQPVDPPAAGPSPTFAAPPPTGPPEHGWEGSVEVDFDTGELTAPGFNELIDADEPDWATDPASTATVLLRLDESDAGGEIDIATEGGDTAPVVVVTNTGIGDDSVAAIRYRISLAAGGDGRYRFDAGEVSWRCQPDRGPQEFGTEPCT